MRGLVGGGAGRGLSGILRGVMFCFCSDIFLRRFYLVVVAEDLCGVRY